MSDKKLTIVYTKTKHGLQVEINGTKDVNWAKHIERANESIINTLKEQYNGTEDKEEAEAKEEAIKKLAKIAEKSVEDIKKEIEEAKGTEKQKFAKIMCKYVEKTLLDLSKDAKDE